MIVFFKAHVDGYTKKDGTFVAPHEDKRAAGTQDAFDVRGVAEKIAESLRRRGVDDFQIQHSGSAAGKSSYIKLPHLNKEIRVSDHSKGAFNSQFYLPVQDAGMLSHAMQELDRHFGAELNDEQYAAYLESKAAKAKAATSAADQEAEERGARREGALALAARQRRGEELTGKERREIKWYEHEVAAGRLAKSHPATRTMIGGDPTPAQAASGKYPKLRQDWHGLTVAIEHPEGTVREGVDETGKPWRTVFRYAYGEILGTTGMDGDPVDVFIGNYPDAPEVYVVQQMKRKQWDVADEQKCMINFASIDEARDAYLSHYDDPRFFGGITALPVAEFIAKVRATRDAPAMIKAVLFFKAHVGPYLRGGKVVNLAGYQGRQARAVASPGQMSLFGGPSSGKPLPPSPLQGKDAVAHTPDLFEPHHTEPTRELIAEHERLVDVLNSPSHADDKAEAKKQAAELADMKQEAGEHDHLLADIPGAKWRRGKGLIAGHYGVEVDGEGIGNYHAKPEDAAAQAKQWLANRAAAKDEADKHSAAVGKLRDRLLSGGEPTDADLKLLGLKDGSSGLKWFIPAAAKVFGITSHAVRPHIKDMIRIGHTDMGTKLEFVSPKKALQAIAAGLAQKPAAAEKVHEWADRESAPAGSWVKVDFKLADSQPVYQVRDLPLDGLYLPELDSSGRLQPEKRKYLDGYTERAKAGERAPSINVIEMESGKLRVVDGHRRVMAARAAGKTTIRALVSPLIDTPDGKKEATAELVAKMGARPAS